MRPKAAFVGTFQATRLNWPVGARFRVLKGRWKGRSGSVVGYQADSPMGTTAVLVSMDGCADSVYLDSTHFAKEVL